MEGTSRCAVTGRVQRAETGFLPHLVAPPGRGADARRVFPARSGRRFYLTAFCVVAHLGRNGFAQSVDDVAVRVAVAVDGGAAGLDTSLVGATFSPGGIRPERG